MAWLITLALFLWIGSAVCKAIDAQSASTSRRIMRMQDAQEEFMANLYVLGWNYYQELEGPVLLSAKDAGIDLRSWIDKEKYSEALNGEPISQTALRRALRDLVAHNEPLFKHDPHGMRVYHLFEGLTQIKAPYPSYVDYEAKKWEKDALAMSGPPCNFETFFDFPTVRYVKSEWIQKQIPEYDDIRVYQDVLGDERYGTPKNYKETIRERRKLERACAKAKANREASMRQCTQTVRDPAPDENGLRRNILIQELRQTIMKIISLKQVHL